MKYQGWYFIVRIVRMKYQNTFLRGAPLTIIFKFTGQVQFTDLDERAIEALKELSEAGALSVLKQFTDSNLQVRLIQ